MLPRLRRTAEPLVLLAVNGVSVTFPSAEMLALLTRYLGARRPAPLGWARSALQRLLDLVLEPFPAQGPATVHGVANLREFARVQLAAEKLPVRVLPRLRRTAEPLVLLVCREQLVLGTIGMKAIA